jgi:methylglyoxal synthase/DNA-binding transcriptional regulator LsrR (DeoR family)
LGTKPVIAILSSEGARKGPDSPLVQFTRSHSKILKRFDIHATAGTAESILSTGNYDRSDVTTHPSGPDGGIVALAAMVAREECATVIFLSDPTDQLWADTVALQRVCREHEIRLVTTLAGAEQWARFEAEQLIKERKNIGATKWWSPRNWREGLYRNIDEKGRILDLPIDHQTLALISHDKMKEELVLFVDKHIDFLNRFDRILTTGTTGYILKLLYCSEAQREEIVNDAKVRLTLERFGELMKEYWYAKMMYGGGSHEQAGKELTESQYAEVMERVRTKLNDNRSSRVTLSGPKPNFVGRLMPLPSGPRGGDILIAEQILRNLCHIVIFFVDPMTAHPHEADIQLLERTCQQKHVYAACVSDPTSADRWARIVGKATSDGQPLAGTLERQLCQQYNLKDAVIVDVEDDESSEPLAKVLARATAGYFHEWLSTRVMSNDLTKVGIGHGLTISQILVELKSMEKERLIKKPRMEKERVVWYPSVANVESVRRKQEAAAITSEFAEFYGGEAKAFRTSNFIEEGDSFPHKEDDDLLHALESSDLILVTGAPWDAEANFYKRSHIDRKDLPPLREAGGPVAMLSTIFLDEKGGEYKWKYRTVGLRYSNLKAAAQRGAVLLICGGTKHREIALSALKGELVSILVTTNFTAEWLLSGPSSK